MIYNQTLIPNSGNPYGFQLNNIGDSQQFQIGTVGIYTNNIPSNLPTDPTDLSVSVSFKFKNPTSGKDIVYDATVTATPGKVSDSSVDYSLTWTQVDVQFGRGWIS